MAALSWELAPFKALIRDCCGLQFEGSAEARLRQAVAERLRRQPAGSAPADYLRRLLRDEGERQALINLLTINETYFFREAEQIQLLVTRIVPRLLQRLAGSRPLRILSAGCSSGEEPYSVLMALWERHGPDCVALFDLHGCDIDSAVLDKARRGRYGEFSFRGVPAEVRERHFEAHAGSLRLKSSLRRLVQFHEYNLVDGPAPAALRDFDVILFRNVSIYFDTEARRRIHQRLAGLLHPDGVVLIGTAETLANDLGVFRLVEEEGLFYFVQGQPPLAEGCCPSRPAARRPAPPPRAPGPPPPAAPPATPRPDTAVLLQLAREKRYGEVLPLLLQALAAAPGAIDLLILKAHVRLERKEFQRAEELARRVLEQDPWSVDALLLMGLAARWSQRGEEAIRWFKQAAYIRHECWPAHYHLAELYRQRQDGALARRAYRVVLQLLSGREADTGVRLLPLHLPAQDVRFLCRHQLDRLDGRPGAH